MLDGLGWVATAFFAASYFCKTSRSMRRVQAAAALLWVCYGIVGVPIAILYNLVLDHFIFHQSLADHRRAIESQHCVGRHGRGQ